MEELKNRIGELTGAVQALGADVAALHALRDEDRQQVQEVEYRATRHTTWLVMGLLGLLLLVVVMVGVNRFTLQQAQRDVTQQVVDCFLRPGSVPAGVAAECARRYGPVYAQRQQQSSESIKRFTDLQRWATENGWTPPPAPEG